MRGNVSFLWGFVCCLLLFALGCSSDDEDNSDNNEDGDLDESVSEVIRAAEGGTLALPSGKATLTVPAGALSEDTELSLSVVSTDELPNADDLGSLGFDFGPDGTTFLENVTIELALEGTVPEDHKAVLAVLDGESWTEIEGSSLKDGTVSGETDHFSTYAIVFVGDSMNMVTSDCEDLDFQACGGDLSGSWSIKDICMEATIGENPFAGITECEDSLWAYTLDWTGTVLFNNDGTYSITNYGFTQTVDIAISGACLVAKWPDFTAEENCTMIEESDNTGTCSYSNDMCTCQSEPTQKTIDDITGTWSVDGNNVTTEEDGGDEGPQTSGYCVEGNVAVSELNVNNATGYMILER